MSMVKVIIYTLIDLDEHIRDLLCFTFVTYKSLEVNPDTVHSFELAQSCFSPNRPETD